MLLSSSTYFIFLVAIFALYWPVSRFRTLTLLWIFPSLGAGWIIGSNRAWLHAVGALAKVNAVRFEQWIAFGLLLAHAWFAWRWWRAARTGIQ